MSCRANMEEYLSWAELPLLAARRETVVFDSSFFCGGSNIGVCSGLENRRGLKNPGRFESCILFYVVTSWLVPLVGGATLITSLCRVRFSEPVRE
jgi:hypothetical protein